MSATESNPVVLYDIPCKTSSRSWSPNMMKTRLLLNLKKIPYRTEWISYPDIEPTFKAIGFQPTATLANGAPLYTCPAIIDPSPDGQVKFTDSLPIALYLDETYNDERRHGHQLFPSGTKQAQVDFLKTFEDGFGKPCIELVLPSVADYVEDPRGSEYFRRTRHERRGYPLTEMLPAGSAKRAEAWNDLRARLDEIAEVYDKNVEGKGEYFTGQHITYVDIVLAAFLFWTKNMPSDRDEGYTCVWDGIKSLNGGRWERHLAKFDDYLEVK